MAGDFAAEESSRFLAGLVGAALELVHNGDLSWERQTGGGGVFQSRKGGLSKVDYRCKRRIGGVR